MMILIINMICCSTSDRVVVAVVVVVVEIVVVVVEVEVEVEEVVVTRRFRWQCRKNQWETAPRDAKGKKVRERHG